MAKRDTDPDILTSLLKAGAEGSQQETAEVDYLPIEEPWFGDFLEWEGKEDSSALDLEGILGSALAVVILGPQDISAPASRALRRSLREVFDWKPTADQLDDEAGDGALPFATWATSQVGTKEAKSGPVDARLLRSVIESAWALLENQPKIGGYIDVGRGRMSPFGPEGEVVARAKSKALEIEPGVLKLSANVMELMEPLGLPTRRNAKGEGRYLGEGDRIRKVSLVGKLAKGLTAWVWGGDGILEGVDAQAGAAHVLRRGHRGHKNTLRKGDALELNYELPDSTFAYLILLGTEGATLPLGEASLSKNEGEDAPNLRVLVGDQRGRIHPLLLGSQRELSGLKAHISKFKGSPSDAQSGFMEYLKPLAEANDQEELILIELGVFEVEATPLELENPDYAKALSLIKRDEYGAAVPILEGLLDEHRDHPSAPTLGYQLGRCLRRTGEAAQARRRLQEAEARGLSLQDSRAAAHSARELARVDLDQGLFAQAELNLRRAIDSHIKAADTVELCRDRLVEGILYWRQGNYEAALKAYGEIVEPARQAGEHSLFAAAHQGLGQVHHELGDLKSAEAHYREAMTGFISAGDRRGESRARGDLGNLAMEAKQWDDAVHHFTQQHQLSKGLEDGVEELRSELNLAMAFKESARLDEAIASLEKARELIRDNHPIYDVAQQLLLGEIYISSAQWKLGKGVLAQLDWETKDLPQDLCWRIILAKGRLALGLGEIERATSLFKEGASLIESARKDLTPNLRKTFLETRVELFDEWLRALFEGDATSFEILEVTELALARSLEESISSSGLQPSAEGEMLADPPRDGLLATLESLDSEMSFLILRPHPQGLLTLWVRGSNVKHRLLDAMDEKSLELASALRQGHLREDSLKLASSTWLAPLADWFEELKVGEQLIIIPQGALYGVPMQALPSPTKEGAYLGGMYPISYSPSLRVMASLLNRIPSQASNILVLANPNGNLPRALDEANTILDLWPSATILRGQEATLKALVRNASNARIIHISSHGENRPEGTDLILAGSTKEEQRLTADTVATLKLDADFVFLASCYSGAGSSGASGEGLRSLVHAYLRAGARSVLAAGWPISDEESNHFSLAFYAALRGGSTRAQALRAGISALDLNNVEPELTEPKNGVLQAEFAGRTGAAFFLYGDPR